MARKQHHEDHVNHEAWAIPYGDLITLLLAFFVVMYAVSSVNEGKYRVLAESMESAFSGPTRTLKPVQIGDQILRAPRDGARAGIDPTQAVSLDENDPSRSAEQAAASMQQLTDDLEDAMGELIDAEQVAVSGDGVAVEVEIKTDILFASASAEIGPDAQAIVARLAQVLRPLASTIRVEGHTDDRPIATAVFPSNWELSAARAARMVRAFEAEGIDPQRMVVAGMGEHHPVGDNTTPQGRSRNRRVTLVIAQSPDELPAAGPRTAVNEPDEAGAMPTSQGEGV